MLLTPSDVFSFDGDIEMEKTRFMTLSCGKILPLWQRERERLIKCRELQQEIFADGKCCSDVDVVLSVNHNPGNLSTRRHRHLQDVSAVLFFVES